MSPDTSCGNILFAFEAAVLLDVGVCPYHLVFMPWAPSGDLKDCGYKYTLAGFNGSGLEHLHCKAYNAPLLSASFV